MYLKITGRRTLADMDRWNPDFAAQSPLLAHLRAAASRLTGERWPERQYLQELFVDADVRTASGMRLKLAAPGGGDGYEKRIYERGELEFRVGNWHDLFNALTWLVFPRAKAALNARHHAALAVEAGNGGQRRGAVRDALTLFDESGVIVVSAEPVLLQMIREFRWKTLFWKHRGAVSAGMRILPFGHALCEKALSPYLGMTGHGLLLDVDSGFSGLSVEAQLVQIDQRVAQLLDDLDTFSHPRELAPVPVLGFPGWHAGNGSGEFYDDSEYFRPGRRRAMTAGSDRPGRSA